ncbi:GntR family transcriptional regulator [Neorhodopirellula lusitana]|uniref:GntR family transcriptional regulator n=1 Tax=Neorhodopirellula lusitana TaxID=445327 RepID=UPI00384F0194
MPTAPLTIREQITNRLRDDLVSGEFPAGATLRETELASKLGVSRGPIRDAFIQLSHEGFLTYQANRGVTVRDPPNPEDRGFITMVRQQIEGYVVEKGIADLDDVGIALVERALRRLKDACDSCEANRIAQCDIAFHEAILIACGGEDFVGAWRLLCSRMLLTYTRLENYEQSYQEHAKIFESLQTKKARATIAALKANIK